jgi:hypothetical protein
MTIVSVSHKKSSLRCCFRGDDVISSQSTPRAVTSPARARTAISSPRLWTLAIAMPASSKTAPKNRAIEKPTCASSHERDHGFDDRSEQSARCAIVSTLWFEPGREGPHDHGRAEGAAAVGEGDRFRPARHLRLGDFFASA